MATFKFIDHSPEVSQAHRDGILRGLLKMGIKAEELISDKIESGYSDQHPNRDDRGRLIGGTHTAIRQTSQLLGSIDHAVEASGKNTVDVGSPEEYAAFVHEGTRYLRGRPFITDACMDGKQQLADAFASEYKKGMKP